MKSPIQFNHVVCAISGGVDSAVTAYLLKKLGIHVTGVFMKNWDSQDEHGTCLSGEKDLDDARSVCRKLDIELVQVSFIKEYWNDVFSSVLQEYEEGMTPNPDISCNRFIKFGALYRYAFNHLGADALATGHYARTSFGPFLESYDPNQNVKLLRGLDVTKDQTLFLSQVNQEPLRRTMFPLGTWFKSQVRNLAQQAGLDAVSTKRDSTGICFIGNRKFSDFIHEYVPEREGEFVLVDTKEVLGWHRGVHHWTLGQRCRFPGKSGRYYVLHRDCKTQKILVGRGTYHPALYSNEITTFEPHWISHPPEQLNTSNPSMVCMFKFQHTEWTIPCKLKSNPNKTLTVHLALPTRAITPGQFAVFYLGDICLGSAKISSARLNSIYQKTPQGQKQLELLRVHC